MLEGGLCVEQEPGLNDETYKNTTLLFPHRCYCLSLIERERKQRVLRGCPKEFPGINI